MDTFTHIALGACIGEAMLGKKIGKRAMILGAIAQSLPDIDFVASFFTSTSENLLAHRGFTHSLLFAMLVTPVIAIAAERSHRPFNVSLKRWMLFFGVQALCHVFIDAFNNYGTAWFEPFSHLRISFNAIYVADPFFSIWPVLAMLGLIFSRSISNKRHFFWKAGLLLSTCYLGYCLVNKWIINRSVQHHLAAKQANYKRYFTTPAPLQSWLWYIVAERDSGFDIAYRSVFAGTKPINFHHFPKNEFLLKEESDEAVIQRLKRFSQGYYTLEKYGDTLVFNDLRFGQIIGWYDPTEKFAFHYYLGGDYDNILVIQRGRFAGWNEEVLRSLWQQAMGN